MRIAYSNTCWQRDMLAEDNYPATSFDSLKIDAQLFLFGTSTLTTYIV